jgi:hypothetical protein
MSRKNEAPDIPSTEEQILGELRKMNKLLTLSSGQKIEEELGKYATSDERKMIWVLIDGKRQAPEIALAIKKTKSAVDKFLQSLENAGLVEERVYGRPPVRAIDYVPASWVELTFKPTVSPEQPAASADSAEQKQTQQEASTIG